MAVTVRVRVRVRVYALQLVSHLALLGVKIYIGGSRLAAINCRLSSELPPATRREMGVGCVR